MVNILKTNLPYDQQQMIKWLDYIKANNGEYQQFYDELNKAEKTELLRHVITSIDVQQSISSGNQRVMLRGLITFEIKSQNYPLYYNRYKPSDQDWLMIGQAEEANEELYKEHKKILKALTHLGTKYSPFLSLSNERREPRIIKIDYHWIQDLP